VSGPRTNPVRGSLSWLGAGLLVSLLLHLSVGVLLVRSARPSLDIRTPTQEVRDEPVRPRLRLGLEESAIASINWLGFAEPTAHAAPELFKLDQAALAREASDPSPPDPSLEPNTPTAPPPSVADRSPVDPAQTPPSETPPAEAVTTEPLPVPAPDSPIVVPIPANGRTASDSQTPEPTPEPASETSPEPAPQTPAPEGPVAPAATPPSPLAIPDDRDATPAAREMSLTLDRLGKPAAGEGVEISTVRLDSQDKAVRMLVGSLRDPVVVMEFKREEEGPATVSTVTFERVEQPDRSFITRSTGNPDIDRILRLNIYRWTATGKAIDELEVGKSLRIRLSIDLR